MRAPARKRGLITTDAVGGVWVYTLEVLRALSPQMQIDLAVLGPPPSLVQRDAAAAMGVKLHVLDAPLEWTAPSPETLARTSAALAELAAGLRMDCVQLHSPALMGQASWAMPVLAVLHSCLGTWWDAMHGRMPPPEDFTWRIEAVRHGLQAADAVIAPSQALSAAARAVYPTARPIHVVHNARKPPGCAANPGERTGILAAGRLWDPAKNITVLERAACLMRDIPVLAAGPTCGPNGDSIALHNIQSLGAVAPKVLQRLMQQARIFAAPALYEPFGLAVLEAAQSGLPLVLADIPTFRELWDGAACFLPPHNPELWARVLSTLHGRAEECTAWGSKARSRAARYSTGRFDRAMREIYRRLLEQPANARAAA